MIEEIEYLVSSFKPHILGISETNFWRHQSLQNVQLENYDLYFAKSLDNPKHNVSRVAVYVNTCLSTEIRYDLMNDSFSSIWLEVGHKYQKNISGNSHG